MTAAVAAPSAYPPQIAALIPDAEALADQLGRVPSRNLLMKELKIGPPKAKLLLEHLTSDPAVEPEPDSPLPDKPSNEVPAADPPADPVDMVAELPRPALLDTSEAAGAELAADETVEAADTAPDEIAPAPVAMPPVVAPVAVAVRRPVTWPVLILCLPAFVAIWAGWVAMGRLTGFGKVTLLPGIFDSFQLDTAITLPIGVETYAAYALWVWLSGRVTGDARQFARGSAIASLAVGALGQVAYHLMNAAGWTSAPWPITAVVACIPVAVLGMGAALAHLTHSEH